MPYKKVRPTMFSQTLVQAHDQLSAQSYLEYLFLRYILARAAIPEIAEFTVPQFPVKIGNKFYRIDYGIVGIKYKFAIELDGFVVHSQKQNFNNDRFRGNDLINDGWVLVRFSTENIKTSPGRCITQLQETLSKDPLLKNYLLNEIVSENPAYTFQEWDAISQQKMALTNKSPAIARSNRDQAFNRLKTTGPNALINRQRAYLESLKNPQFISPAIIVAAQPDQPSSGSFEKIQSSSGSLQILPSFWRRLSRITRLALIGGSTLIIISALIIAFVLLPMLTQKSPSPAKVNPAITQPASPGISLADEIAAQPCLVGQIKGSQSKIYHLPGQKFYAETKDNVTCFTSEAEAQNAGFRKG